MLAIGSSGGLAISLGKFQSDAHRRKAASIPKRSGGSVA